jgi:small-conductance mechanosensitive channel
MPDAPTLRPGPSAEPPSRNRRGPATTRARNWSLRVVAAALLATGGLTLVSVAGTLTGVQDVPVRKVLLLGGTALFAIGCVITTRMLASDVERRLAQHGLESSGVAVRIALNATGYLIVIVVAASLLANLLSISLQQFVLGASLTGVVLGIAAQQTLGNVFAGVVILLVQPFRVGSEIVVRSGQLNGPFPGTVRSLGLTYTTLVTDDGVMMVPNSQMLAAAVTVERMDDGETGGIPQ